MKFGNEGNDVKPDKTLHKKDLEANGVKTAADIVAKMRNPGLGMTKFDEKTIPDEGAKQIAEYIILSGHLIRGMKILQRLYLCHCEEGSDEAISAFKGKIASLRSQ